MIDVILGKVLFYILALFTIGTAMIVTFGRNLVRSAFALFFTLMGMASIFVFLAADFVAIMQVLVYAGGILVLILFGVWLTHRIITLDIQAARVNLVAGLVMGILMLLTLFFTIRSFHWGPYLPIDFRGTAQAIGRLLLSDYLLPFEVATVALLIALIGAVVIGRREVKP